MMPVPTVVHRIVVTDIVPCQIYYNVKKGEEVIELTKIHI
jgi:hypothetical protein